ncbi:MAG: MFS transporter [bacterium]
MKQNATPLTDETKRAFQLIIFFGLISLFGDIVYEGARAVNGPYLKTLAANAAMVGLIAGFGEFAGYALRLLSGYYADKTKAYWAFTFVGYGLIIAIPLLSLTGIWQMAAVFMVLERIGKGIRAPAKDSIVSSAAKRVGTGKGFAIQEVMDQFGALLGPLIFAGYFALTGGEIKVAKDYQHAYGLFWIPFLLVMIFAVIAYMKVPDPSKLEPPKKITDPDKITKLFWIYTIFSFITAFGFMNFAIIGFHFKSQNVLSDVSIPIYYAIAMAVDGVAAYIMGMWYDKLKEKFNHHGGGLATLIVLPILSALIPFFAFTKSPVLALVSAILWGIVMGGHETIMKAAIADITPLKKRGTGYGIFNFSYGLAMLGGAYLTGLLYDISIPVLCWSAVFVQIIAIVVFFILKKEIRTT